MLGQIDTELEAGHRGSRSSYEKLEEWYSEGLRSKLERAVADGRVDAGRADELDRLMAQLLESDCFARSRG